MIAFLSTHFSPLIWSGLTFIAGVASKGIVDSYFRRRDDLHKFLLDKRVKFLEEQLSQFYWPMYLHLEKDNLIWERLLERNHDPDSPHSRLSIQIETGVILPNHREALTVIETYLHLAGDTQVVEASLRYVRHVKIYEMLRAADIKEDPVNHGEPYPKDYFPLMDKRVHALQAEYDQLILRLLPSEGR
jgi:hypothetical protein